MRCSNCPCPDICLQWDAFCAQAAKVPQVPNEIKHICNRSRIGVVTTNGSQMPSIGRQAYNVAGAIGRVAAAALAGKQVNCTPEQKAEREAICQGCDKLVNGKCLLCGCPYLRKLARATENCPIGRWPKLEVAS
jgi:hypothetical protein